MYVVSPIWQDVITEIWVEGTMLRAKRNLVSVHNVTTLTKLDVAPRSVIFGFHRRKERKAEWVHRVKRTGGGGLM